MAYVALVVGVMGVSVSAILVRWSAAPALALVFYRLILAEILLLPLAIIRDRVAWKDVSRRDVMTAMISGVCLSLHFITWVSSLNYTSVASSVALVSIHPILVVIASAVVLGHSLKPGAVVGVVVAVLGSIIIPLGSYAAESRALTGDVLALSGAFFMALYLLFGAHLRQRWSLWMYTSLVYGVAGVVTGLAAVGSGIPLGGYPAREWMIFVGLAVFPTLLGHTVFNWALGRLPTALVALSILGEPIGAAVLAWMLLGEGVPFFTWVGGTMILVGLARFLFSQSRPEVKQVGV